MKRSILILVFSLFLGSFNAGAETISSQTARSAADIFLSGKSEILAAKSAQNAFLSDTQAVRNESGTTIAYVHSFDKGGFIITAADDRIRPILGYSDKGSFDFTDSGNNVLLYFLKRDISLRLEALEAGDKDMLENSIENSANWNKLAGGFAAAKNADAAVYGPLIQTNWHQDFPYSKYCPIDPVTDLRSYAGCVTNIVIQLFNYWQYPKSLSFDAGDSYLSSWRNADIAIFEDSERLDFPGIDQLNEALSEIRYDGDMDELAWLYFGSGIKTESTYSSVDTAAYMKNIPFDSFGYSSTKITTSLSEANVHSVENIKNGIPVAMAIDSSEEDMGHAVIVDGYDEANELFHINFGYGDLDFSNTWYNIPNIGYLGFDEFTFMIYDIIPDENIEFEEISGVVLDPNGIPVKNAAVEVNPGSATAYTDETGTFSFRLPVGTEKTIMVKHPRYAFYQAAVNTSELSISLEKTDDPTLALYHFDSDGTDASGYGNNFTVDQAVTSLVPGKYGNALKITGQGACLHAETQAFSTGDMGSLTIETWVQVTTKELPYIYVGLFFPHYFYLNINENFTFEILAQNINDEAYYVASPSMEGRIALGDWIHLAAVYSEKETLRLYVNGRLEGETDTPYPLAPAPGAYLGTGILRGDRTLYEVPVIMDETRISAAALQPGEFIGSEFNGSLTVTVSDGDSGVLSGAELTVEPGGYTMKSGEDGVVLFDSLPARDDYTITVSADGFDPVTASNIEVATGNGASLAFDITGNVVGVDNDSPIAFELGNPFPNPFNAGVSISYSLAETAPVELTLYSISGQLVKTISKGTMQPGRYSESIDSAGLPNGVFFIRLDAGNNSAVKKIVHVK